jgi:hypothetical protein
MYYGLWLLLFCGFRARKKRTREPPWGLVVVQQHGGVNREL